MRKLKFKAKIVLILNLTWVIGSDTSLSFTKKNIHAENKLVIEHHTPCSTSYTTRVGVRSKGLWFQLFYFSIAEVFLH